MIKEISAIIKSKTQAEWVEAVGDKDICFSPVNGLKEAFEDPHNVARNMIVEYDVPEYGKVKAVSFPAKFSETPFKVTSLPPKQGQHTAEILKELGFQASDIEKLKTEKVI